MISHSIPAALILFMGLASNACSSPSGASRTPAPPPHASMSIMEEPSNLVTQTGTIYGTLELPAATFPVPVVLIIAGSGPTDRDGNSKALPGSNNSLKLLASELASRGIASVRYDKRGIAASMASAGTERDLRFDNYVADAEGWIRKLRSDSRFTAITVAGHSEGSLVGMIAAREAGADGYVSLEGDRKSVV